MLFSKVKSTHTRRILCRVSGLVKHIQCFIELRARDLWRSALLCNEMICRTENIIDRKIEVFSSHIDDDEDNDDKDNEDYDAIAQ